jgi:hypothetical protein
VKMCSACLINIRVKEDMAKNKKIKLSDLFSDLALDVNQFV